MKALEFINFNLLTTLQEVRNWIAMHFGKEPVICPACDQRVDLVKRTIHQAPARMLVVLYRMDKEEPNQYFHASQLVKGISSTGTNDLSKMVYWGLIEAKEKEITDGLGRTNGYWRITDKGKLFVEGKITIPKHVGVYNKKSYDFSGGEITLSDALGVPFDYQKMMAGEL